MFGVWKIILLLNVCKQDYECLIKKSMAKVNDNHQEVIDGYKSHCSLSINHDHCMNFVNGQN